MSIADTYSMHDILVDVLQALTYGLARSPPFAMCLRCFSLLTPSSFYMTRVHLPGTTCICRCLHMLAIVVEHHFSCNPCIFLLSSFVHAFAMQLDTTASLKGDAASLDSRDVIMYDQHIVHGVTWYALQALKSRLVLACGNNHMQLVNRRSWRLSHQSRQHSSRILGVIKQKQKATPCPLCLTMIRKSASLTA